MSHRPFSEVRRSTPDDDGKLCAECDELLDGDDFICAGCGELSCGGDTCWNVDVEGGRCVSCAAALEETQPKESTVEETKKSRRGFAAMDPAKQKEIARKGGRAAHVVGTAHEFTPDEARVAGKRGGAVVSRDREHMARIGRFGGQARAGRARMRAAAALTNPDETPS